MRISDWSSDVCSSDLSDPAHNSRRRDPIGLRNTTRRGALDGRTPRAVHGGESGKGRPARPAGACMNVGGGIAEHGPPPIREITMAAAHPTLPLPSGEPVPVLGRSDERTVGKECGRTGGPLWSPDHDQKKTTN